MEQEKTGQIIEELDDLFTNKGFHFRGAKAWKEYTGSSYFRAQWREDGDDLVYNFFHPDGPNMQKGFDDPKAKIEQGEDAALSEEVADLIIAIFKTVVADVIRYDMDYIPEVLCWQFRLKGKASNMMARQLYTQRIFDTLDANLPQLFS